MSPLDLQRWTPLAILVVYKNIDVHVSTEGVIDEHLYIEK